MKNKLKTSFAWVGGKYKLADTIVSFIDKTEHKIYVEPFCGALSYNNCDEILMLYKDFNIHSTSVKQCFRAKYQKDRAELIITNF